MWSISVHLIYFGPFQTNLALNCIFLWAQNIIFLNYWIEKYEILFYLVQTF